MQDYINKYAKLISQYCISVKPNDKVYIRSSYLARPLIEQLLLEIATMGGIGYTDIVLPNQAYYTLNNATEEILKQENPFNKLWSETFDGYVFIRAPYLKSEDLLTTDSNKLKINKEAQSEITKIYMARTGDLSLKRTLLQYPTEQSAIDAGMSIEDYTKFIYEATMVSTDHPIEGWQQLGRNQQNIVDYLNSKTQIQYNGKNIDITFNTLGRKWINSDGKTNMPSGEVYTSPIDNSTNGWVKYTIPSTYNGHRFEEVELEFKDGIVVNHNAKIGKKELGEILATKGANMLGECAIGTNYNITKPTNNILFDEKIGGTIHMALGQAYSQCGGINESSVHWDLITDLTDGEIVADGEVCYRDGKFVI